MKECKKDLHISMKMLVRKGVMTPVRDAAWCFIPGFTMTIGRGMSWEEVQITLIQPEDIYDHIYIYPIE